MRQLLPEYHEDVDDGYLERLYDYPDGTWVAVNFVSSVDGGIEVRGTAAGLSNAADRRVFELGSDLADVVLIGAGTAMAEEFHGVRPSERTADRRRRFGLAPVPPIAVVSSGHSLPADAPVLTDVLVPTIVITSASAPSPVRRAWTDAGADVLVAGESTVDLDAAVAELAARGLRRSDCEGGPRLHGAMLRANLVHELRLTVSPMLISGPSSRVAVGEAATDRRLRLASLLQEQDTLLARYLVR